MNKADKTKTPWDLKIGLVRFRFQDLEMWQMAIKIADGGKELVSC